MALSAAGPVVAEERMDAKAPTAAASGPKPMMKMPMTSDINASSASDPKAIGDQLRAALGTGVKSRKKLTLVVGGGAGPIPPDTPAASPRRNSMTPAFSNTSAQFQQARAAALGIYAPIRLGAPTANDGWSYAGDTGPQNWGRIRPEFTLCAVGRRQSPIGLDDGTALLGPAAGIDFHYAASNASVLNNGHTIVVSVSGDNTMVLRGTSYQLTEINFHTPSEIQVNGHHYAMSANLLHRSADGKLAILSVLLDVGEVNALVNKVWTYLPLDISDKVDMPVGLLNANELLPADQRYYQFMGSLTTPPCTEGVVWVVIKQPLTISEAQFRLFTQLFPMNARPLQPINGRAVRDQN